MRAGKASRLLLLLAGTMMALALLELAVRALGLAPGLAAIEIDEPYGAFVSSPDPRLAYVPKPGSGDINADGFRDRDFGRSKPQGTYRIVVIGDSIGFGYCNETRAIPVDRTFPRLLENELNADGPTGIDRFEVLNFSVSGYDTIQEAAFLEAKALAYDPDLVLVAFCLNDLTLASRELFLLNKDTDWNAYRETAELLYRNAIFRSHLVRLVWYRLSSRPADSGIEETTDGSPRGMPRALQGFRELRRLSSESGFETLVVIFPMFREFERYPSRHQHDAIAAAARAHGFDAFDLLPSYAEASHAADLCTPCCDLHPNQDGHAVTATAIAAHLRRTLDRSNP